MNPYDRLKSLDEIIMNKHEGIANKLNEAFGWTKYEIAKHINYARIPVIVGGSGYASYAGFSEGNINKGILFSLVGPLLASLTILDHGRINEKIEKQKDNSQEHRNIVSSELTLDTYVNPKFLGRLADFVGWPGMCAVSLATMHIVNGSKTLEENSVLPSFIYISSFTMYYLIKGSIKYLTDSDNNTPKKGKFFEAIDSIRETAGMILKHPVPALNPKPSISYADFATI